MVGVGTVAEIFVPMTPGGKISKATDALGDLAKTGAKGLGASATTAENIGRVTTGVVDVVGSQNLLYPVAKYTGKGLSNVVDSSPLVRAAATESKILAAAGPEGQMIVDAVPAPKLKDTVLQPHASVAAKYADDVSDFYSGVAARADGLSDTAIDAAVASNRLSARTGALAKTLSPQQAQKVLDTGAQSKTIFLKESAIRANEAKGPLKASLEGMGVAGGRTPNIDVVTDFNRLQQEIRTPVLETLAKTDIGDYVMLTDRTVVSSKSLGKVSL